MKEQIFKGLHFRKKSLGPKQPSPCSVVFLRHGESLYNKQKKFTGWSDVALTPTGIEEARTAGKLLKKEGFQFDICFTSYLTRAIQTFHYLSEQMDCMHIPLIKSWKLNQRHYGELQGLSKTETIEKYGKDQVQKWRRSFDISPPALNEKDKRHPKYNKKYKDVPPEQLPTGESLKMTMERVLPYWQTVILPEIAKGRRVLIIGHQNALRGIIRQLDQLTNDFLTQLDIPTAIPLVYEFDQSMHKLSHYYILNSQDYKQQIVTLLKQSQK